ncbi:MAG: PilZ domain-containing protein [Rhodospirillaceae bacterium]|jgi:hypothetical protein|nr:PilZ domain-containing protein [Rhodospirillaceae bacterium]
MPTTQRIADQRHFRRAQMSLVGMLAAGGRKLPCQIRDVSAGGARVDVETAFDGIEAVGLCIGAFDPIPGDIVWRRDSTIGIQFSGNADDVAETLAGIVVYT